MPLEHTQQDSILRALLVEERQRAGLRQSDLAAKLATPQSFVSKYESGERRLDVLELREICAALGISLHDFVRRLDERLASSESGAA